MGKILFIEGIPGSGKSTVAKKIATHLESIGETVKLYNEGDLHPIDLAWCAILSEIEYNSLLNKYSKYKDQIESHSRITKLGVVTAYTKVRVDDEDVSFYDEYGKYEIYKTGSLDVFKTTHVKLWKDFVKAYSTDTWYVFECVYLQNHINELILKFNLNEKQIIDYFMELISCIGILEPSLIYLNPTDVDFTVNRVIEERRSNSAIYKDWITLVVEYFENSKFGKKLHYVGEEGALKYFKDRINLEHKVLSQLDIETLVYDVKDNYDEVLDDIKKAIQK